MKKLKLITLLSLLCVASLVGCGKKEVVEETPVYELKSYTSEELEKGNYYIKSGESYYLLAHGTLCPESGGSDIASSVNKDRVLWFAADEVEIPTMYEEDELIYVTDGNIPQKYIWERFKDLGYSVGIRNLTTTDSGKYVLKKINGVTQPISDAYEKLKEVEDETTMSIDKIGGVNINETNVSECGTITGLTKDSVYTLDTYLGTTYKGFDITADTRIFNSFEIYQSSTYELSQNGYAIISLPDNLVSGYYYLNGKGLFKYSDCSKLESNPNIDYNEAYYIGYDDNGNLITKDDISTQSGSDDSDTKADYEKIWNSKINLDCAQENMTIDIKYTDIINIVNGQKVELKSKEEDVLPEAIITSPDNKTYEFENNSREENCLTCSIDSPLTGEWVVTMKNMDNRTFDVNTSFISGHSDNLVHTGNGTSQMTVYLDQNLIDGLFMFKWENTDHAADIIIETPTGEKYGKSINSEDLYDEGYGYIDIRLGECISGNYVISVTGEDLGRVRWTYKENYSSEYTIQDNTNEDVSTDSDTNNNETSTNSSAEDTNETSNDGETKNSSDNSDFIFITE